MKSWMMLALALAAATAARAEESEPAVDAPSPFRRMMPERMQVGLQLGVAASRFAASREYDAYIEPTPAKDDQWIAPSYGFLLAARWKHAFTLRFGYRRESYGLETREETVSFPDNPFPHTLRASTDLSYNVWPLILGMGWFGSRSHFQAQLGVFRAFLDQADVQWIVDGERYDNLPRVTFKDYSGWIFGTEYGYRMGSTELVLGLETQRGFGSMMSGMEGSIKAESARILIGCLWTLPRGR